MENCTEGLKPEDSKTGKKAIVEVQATGSVEGSAGSVLLHHITTSLTAFHAHCQLSFFQHALQRGPPPPDRSSGRLRGRRDSPSERQAPKAAGGLCPSPVTHQAPVPTTFF